MGESSIIANFFSFVKGRFPEQRGSLYQCDWRTRKSLEQGLL